MMRIIYAHPDYGRDGMTPAVQPEKPLPHCKEQGQPLRGEESLPCEEKKRDCGLHGVCTSGVPRDGLPCCATCKDHTERKSDA